MTKGEQQIWKQDESSEQLHQSGEQLTIDRNLPLASLEPGDYTLEVFVLDLLSNRTVVRSAHFSVKAPATPKPIAGLNPPTGDDFNASAI